MSCWRCNKSANQPAAIDHSAASVLIPSLVLFGDFAARARQHVRERVVRQMQLSGRPPACLRLASCNRTGRAGGRMFAAVPSAGNEGRSHRR
ncbi:MAG: hypothetical protein DCC67_18160 [Planctomycetota bacterium]|nr:MAG: hypothetical protein DCC67_18160 [Planctomycetota bacterium]